MLNTYIWKIEPFTQPAVIRSCPKCGGHSEYECSGNFRVNANQNHIDVWLIYQCKKCKSTWNMEILSRVSPNSMDRELYQKFLRNDKKLAKQYAFDPAAHTRNKSVINFENLTYDIISNTEHTPSYTDCFRLKLNCSYPLDLRMDKLLSQKFGISREQVKKLCRTGRITGTGIKDVTKAKLKDGMLLEFNCPDYL